MTVSLINVEPVKVTNTNDKGDIRQLRLVSRTLSIAKTKPFNSFQSFSSYFFDLFNVVSEMSYSGARVIYQNTRAQSCLANHKSEITDCDRLTTRFWDIHSQRRRSLATKTENNLTICWRQAWTSWAGLGDTKADNTL